MRSLPIGIDNFKKAREGNYALADKSLFIQGLLDDPAETICITRPRRFCKTSNLDMTYRFFSIENATENRLLFNGTAIENALTSKGQPCINFQGQYPTVFVTFKSVRASSYESALEDIKICMGKLYDSHRYLLDSDKLTDQHKHYFNQVLEEKINDEHLQIALVNLTRYLNLHFNKKVIVLMDEYDTPFHTAYTSKTPYHEDLINFMKVFLGETFKGNEHLEKGIITGILRVSLMDLFSGANNVAVRSLLSDKYAPFFGLTENEVTDLLNEAQLQSKSQEIKEWYNGYQVGGVTLYNPWSIINCLDNQGELVPYWNNSGQTGILGAALRQAPVEVKEDFAQLFQGHSIWTRIDEGTVFADFTQNKYALFGAFLFSGYLKVIGSKKIDDEQHYEVKIPNREILLAFKKMIEQWFREDHLGTHAYERLFNVIDQGDMEGFKDQVQHYLDVSGSCHDLGPKTLENVYHMLVFGMMFVLRDRYTIGSNLEAGKGYPDIYLIPKDNTKLGIIFEFKRTSQEPLLQKKVDEALQQIDGNRYRVRLQEAHITQALHVGMAFCGKEIAMRYELHQYASPVAAPSSTSTLSANPAALFHSTVFDAATTDLQSVVAEVDSDSEDTRILPPAKRSKHQ